MYETFAEKINEINYKFVPKMSLKDWHKCKLGWLKMKLRNEVNHKKKLWFELQNTKWSDKNTQFQYVLK